MNLWLNNAHILKGLGIDEFANCVLEIMKI